ncbi:MAG: ABC transporter permease [Nanoarchaeota archaeon]
MISLFEIYGFVVRNMLEKKKRVLLTISGIVIGIFTFVFFIFVSQGLTNAISEQFTSFGVNVLGVQPAGNAGNPGGDATLTDTEIARIKQVARDYVYVAPMKFYTGQYEYGREKAVITTVSYGSEYLDEINEDLGIEVSEGRTLRSTDSGVVVLGAKTAKDAFSRELTVGNSIQIQDRSFRVIGIIEERGDLFVDNSMLMSIDDVNNLEGDDGYTGIRISFLEGADLEANQEAIERKLNPNGKEKKYEVTSPTQVLEQFNQILGLLTGIISFISSIALLVGGINVMNTMYSNVLERINEISVMKALGATNQDIRNIFIFESGMLGLVGAFVGFLGAYFLAEIISFWVTGLGYNVPINFDWMFFGIVLVVTSFMAMLFGTYPALKAAHTNPADNLRDE